MNYYEKHLGDYLKNAAHLTLLEHGVYGRLMDVYYVQEAPILATKAARLIAARSEEELAALRVVLEEFFDLLEDGCWHQSRCDEDIAAYQAGEPEREVKKANELNRNKLHRLERSRLFQVITAAGEHAAWNAPISEIRKMVDRIQAGKPPTPSPATAPGTGTGNEPGTPAPAPATPATATQTPDTRHQSPDTISQVGKTGVRHANSGASVVTPTLAGSACLALRRAGVQDGNTSHPKLLALLAQGVTDDELTDAAGAVPEAKRKFAYVLGVVEGRRRDAASIGTLPPARRGAAQQSDADRLAETRRLLGFGPEKPDQEVIDA